MQISETHSSRKPAQAVPHTSPRQAPASDVRSRERILILTLPSANCMTQTHSLVSRSFFLDCQKGQAGAQMPQGCGVAPITSWEVMDHRPLTSHSFPLG